MSCKYDYISHLLSLEIYVFSIRATGDQIEWNLLFQHDLQRKKLIK
jgi:hypothetical protein